MDWSIQERVDDDILLVCAWVELFSAKLLVAWQLVVYSVLSEPITKVAICLTRGALISPVCL